MTVSADQGSIADVGSPVLIAPDAIDAARPWRWTTGVILVATALLLLLNASTIGEWLEELPASPAVERLRAPITGWAATTERARLDRPRAAAHALWQRARAARFGSEQPGERGEN